ncbi:hypothetical protein GN244_ATG06026 [Phytophthora infestans]|uniref:Uncharacterized protein n=1 Tax=Phytophthora infestans TaxID=4787 RepID=A0A833T3F0_PHYIN|nr:hypothetical protein GN244_ATG06026 [Phytophthora infestans]
MAHRNKLERRHLFDFGAVMVATTDESKATARDMEVSLLEKGRKTEYDPFASEQTWPTNKEIAEAEAEAKKQRQADTAANKGASSYQTAWLDGYDEEDEMKDDKEETDAAVSHNFCKTGDDDEDDDDDDMFMVALQEEASRKLEAIAAKRLCEQVALEDEDIAISSLRTHVWMLYASITYPSPTRGHGQQEERVERVRCRSSAVLKGTSLQTQTR